MNYDMTAEPDDESEHDCTDDDHAWEYFDDSFDHEYGTEIDIYRQCVECGIHEQGPFDLNDGGYDE